MVTMKTNKTFRYTLLALFATVTLFVACDKVSPTGVLIGNTSTDDRVKMSLEYYQNHKNEGYYGVVADDDDTEYSFLVGSDSHLATDTGRLAEMFQMCLDDGDLLCAHLGDIADTKAEYYVTLDNLLDTYKWKMVDVMCDYDSATGKYYDKDDKSVVNPDSLQFPLYVAVGNHDITHNGWALFSSIFHSSFFQIYIIFNDGYCDRLIFLDSANGTLGNYQIDAIENDAFLQDYELKTRNIFVFTHSNLFRPSYNQFSSTFAREELYYLLNKFSEWKTKIVFCGHVHAWDDREVGGVRYLTLESMSERNSPDPGDYLVRVHVAKDGSVTYERVRMNYVKK